MAEVALSAEMRNNTGSAPSRRLRSSGKIPGVVYGHGIDPVAVTVNGRELRAALTTEAGLNALLALKIDGDTHLVLPREIQRDPVRGKVSHVDFVTVRRGEVVSAEVPINLIGEANEVRKADGVVEHQLFSLTVQATPDRIPPHLEVDISGLQVGDTVRVGDLTLPDGVNTEVDAEEAVVLAKASTLAADLEADLEAAAEEAAEAAPEGEAADKEKAEGDADAGEGGSDSNSGGDSGSGGGEA